MTAELAPVMIYDIEATHLKSNFGHVLCISYKPLGGKTKTLSIRDYARNFKAQPWSDTRVLEDVYDVLSTAHTWVTYFGDGFDFPYLQSRMLKAGIGVLPPNHSFDVYKHIAKPFFPLHSRRLDSLAKFLNTKTSKTFLDPEVWERAQYGSVADIKYIEDHCEKDVDVLEEVYLKTRGLSRRHPVRTREPLGTACNVCGGTNLEKRGFEYSRAIVWQRFQCKTMQKGIPCGAWGRIRVKAAAA